MRRRRASSNGAVASAQLGRREVDVQPRRFGARVAGEEGDVVQVYAAALEDGAALMAQGVRGQLGHTQLRAHLLDYVIERAKAHGLPRIAVRLGHEEWPRPLAAERVDDVPAIQLDVAPEHELNDGRERHRARPPALGGLGAHGDEAARPVDVVEPERDQLLAPQGTVVGEQDHRRVAPGLMGERVADDTLPHLIRRRPR